MADDAMVAMLKARAAAAQKAAAERAAAEADDSSDYDSDADSDGGDGGDELAPAPAAAAGGFRLNLQRVEREAVSDEKPVAIAPTPRETVVARLQAESAPVEAPEDPMVAMLKARAEAAQKAAAERAAAEEDESSDYDSDADDTPRASNEETRAPPTSAGMRLNLSAVRPPTLSPRPNAPSRGRARTMTDARWHQVTREEVPDDYVPVAVPPTPKEALLARLERPAPPEEEAEASTSAAPMLDLTCASVRLWSD